MTFGDKNWKLWWWRLDRLKFHVGNWFFFFKITVHFLECKNNSCHGFFRAGPFRTCGQGKITVTRDLRLKSLFRDAFLRVGILVFEPEQVDSLSIVG